jgi:hypothetical protein
LVAPGTTALFTNHWKAGEAPPLEGVAVNMTGVPSQTGLDEAEIVTPTGNIELTVMTNELEVAGLPVEQVAFEVSIQTTTSLFTGMKLKRALVAPFTFVPFTFH